jgi:hypothetical protein
MRLRPLGRTGPEISELGFGASPPGSVYGAFPEADGIKAVHTALDLGVTPSTPASPKPSCREPRPAVYSPARKA